jgi:peptidoglycan L-alanyl-D-glutamate endopeptidase CwlK
MFFLSERSANNRDTCHPNLIELIDASIITTSIDFSVISGGRGEKEQNLLYEKGYSKLKYPHSKHNTIPSHAFDAQPYPYTKEDKEDPNHTKFRLLNEHIKKIAKDLDIPVINGGLDWGWDWFHWEIVL